MYGQRQSEPATLVREVLATQIPSGEKQILPPGAQVIVLQSLGGNVTVMAPSGQMVRWIASMDEPLDTAVAYRLGRYELAPPAPPVGI